MIFASAAASSGAGKQSSYSTMIKPTGKVTKKEKKKYGFWIFSGFNYSICVSNVGDSLKQILQEKIPAANIASTDIGNLTDIRISEEKYVALKEGSYVTLCLEITYEFEQPLNIRISSFVVLNVE